jgi:hypothetical protein
MNDLKSIINLLGKKVKIIDIDNIEHIGYFLDYTTAPNNDNNEWSIDVFPSKTSNSGVELYQSEIISIEAVGV